MTKSMFLTKIQVAHMLNMRLDIIEYLVKNRMIPHYQIYHYTRFNRNEIVDWLKSLYRPVAPKKRTQYQSEVEVRIS